MKKKIGLLAIIGLLVSFMAFSGVASAQASNVQVVFFTQPGCSACAAAHPIVQAAATKYGVTLVTYDFSTPEGKGVATANGVSETPTIIISGAQSARFEGSVIGKEAQIESAIKAAIGTTTVKAPVATVKAPVATVKAPVATVKAPVATVKAPTVVKQAVATKPTTPFIGDTQTHVVHLANCYHVNQMKVANMKGFYTLADAQAQGYRPCKDCLPTKVIATPDPNAAKTVAKTAAQPAIEVVTANQTSTTATQTVPEFSLLGLGAPALVVGAIYLFLRRR
jgi:thiol-disulfide isomerase/thioredoxin